MLIPVALCLASHSKEYIDEDASLPPPHLIVPVDLSKGSGSVGYYPYSALVDLGATYNFISQFVADKLSLEMVKAGKSKFKKKLLLLSLQSRVNHCMLLWLYGR